MQPLGGTELQYAQLYKHVDNTLLDKFQITTSIPEKIPLSKDKINILWAQNSYDQSNLAPWFEDKSNHSKYDWYVFNSHWCAEKFRMVFKVPPEKCVVIKNAIKKFADKPIHKNGDKIKLIYTSTPWRGLSVLLGAMQLIKNPLIELDVYSSTQIYGDVFKKANDVSYQELYEQAKKLPNVNYIGYASNKKIMNKMGEYKIFAYPNIWEETSCMSAIEALGSGLHAIVTNYGALFETCSEWPTYVQYDRNYRNLSRCFAYAIEGIAKQLHSVGMQQLLDSQVSFYKKFYSWENRKNEWTNFLQGAYDAKSRTNLV
jgi:UDP-glucose:(glucosyl)LPS alpha-1,2-glucosyltransferase